MSTTTERGLTDKGVTSRMLREGYGPGAWHRPDLKAALADVTVAQALWRPGLARHNIAELALHHAYYVRSVRTRMAGPSAEPFVLQGDDWFDLSDEHGLSWQAVQATVASEQQRLSAA